MRIAYIANGKLHILGKEGNSQQIESRFAQEVIARSQRIAENRAWRSGGQGVFGTSVWNNRHQTDPDAIKINFSDVSPGASGDEILYCLQTDSVCGMFTYLLNDGHETRLFHKNDFHLREIHRHHQLPQVIAALEKSNRTCNLVLFDGDSPHYRELTEGDSRDESPWWEPGPGRRLLYQSAGIGRNRDGFAVGVGPAAVMQLDLDQGKLETLLQSERYDYLQPRRGPAGELLYIRRPWQQDPGAHNRGWQSLVDLLAFPFRLARAVFEYLNVFSMIYSRKPLRTAGGPPGDEKDVSKAMMKGRLLNVQRALRSFNTDKDAPPLVPKSWQLMARDGNGQESVIAERVSSFDVTESGVIVFSNGTGIFRIGSGQAAPERLGRNWLVDRVVVLDR